VCSGIRRTALLGSVILSFATAATAAQPLAAWRQVGPGLPATPVSGVLLAAPNGSTLYSVARQLLFKSTDGSDSWTPLSGVTGVYSFLSDPRNPATLYAGTSHGVLKSTDGGSTWMGVNNGLPRGWPAWAQLLAIDPVSPSILYVQKWQGLFRSADGGQSWSALKTAGVDFQIQKLFIDPTHMTMYAGLGSGLFKSTDGGMTWRKVSATGVTGYCCDLLTFDPGTSTLYARGGVDPVQNPGHYGPLYKSTDQGNTWRPAGRGIPDDANFSLAADPINPGTIYAPYVQLSWSGAPPLFGLLKTTDGGDSWKPVQPAVPGTFILSLAVDGKSTVYIDYASGDAYKSADGGTTWSPVKAIPAVVDVPALLTDPAQPNVLYAAAGDNGIFRSGDGGGDWAKLSSFQFDTNFYGHRTVGADFLAAAPHNSQILYAGSICFLYRSADAGMNWQNLYAGQQYCGESGVLALDPSDPNTIFLGQLSFAEGDSSLRKTSDGGATWRQVWFSSESYIVALAVDPATSNRVYAGVSSFSNSSRGLLRSTDGGENWSEVDLGPTVNVVAFDPTHPSILYAATATDNYSDPTGFDGLFKSTDAGASWSAINTGLEILLNTGAPITALAFYPGNSDILYAATSGNGVFRSTDGGAHWSTFNDGLSNFDVHAVATSAGRPGFLYASTSGGVFAVPIWDERRTKGTGRR
jgi:photosystem II stability/assembly factor-like uncharacterized protein